MIIYENYPRKQHPESGLCVAIERDGIRVVEIQWVEFDTETGWLVTSALYTWDAYHKRHHCYSGDDNGGKARERLTAAAISLLAYWGGEEKLFRHKSDAKNYAREYIHN